MEKGRLLAHTTIIRLGEGGRGKVPISALLSLYLHCSTSPFLMLSINTSRSYSHAVFFVPSYFHTAVLILPCCVLSPIPCSFHSSTRAPIPHVSSFSHTGFPFSHTGFSFCHTAMSHTEKQPSGEWKVINIIEPSDVGRPIDRVQEKMESLGMLPSTVSQSVPSVNGADAEDSKSETHIRPTRELVWGGWCEVSSVGWMVWGEWCRVSGVGWVVWVSGVG